MPLRPADACAPTTHRPSPRRHPNRRAAAPQNLTQSTENTQTKSGKKVPPSPPSQINRHRPPKDSLPRPRPDSHLGPTTQSATTRSAGPAAFRGAGHGACNRGPGIRRNHDCPFNWGSDAVAHLRREGRLIFVLSRTTGKVETGVFKRLPQTLYGSGLTGEDLPPVGAADSDPEDSVQGTSYAHDAPPHLILRPPK